MITVLVGSIAGYAAYNYGSGTDSGTSSSVKYNGVTFTNSNGFWAATFNGMSLQFLFPPEKIDKRVLDLNGIVSTIILFLTNFKAFPLHPFQFL